MRLCAIKSFHFHFFWRSQGRRASEGGKPSHCKHRLCCLVNGMCACACACPMAKCIKLKWPHNKGTQISRKLFWFWCCLLVVSLVSSFPTAPIFIVKLRQKKRYFESDELHASNSTIYLFVVCLSTLYFMRIPLEMYQFITQSMLNITTIELTLRCVCVFDSVGGGGGGGGGRTRLRNLKIG